MARLLLFETSTEEQNRLGEQVNEENESNDVPYPTGLLYLDSILTQKDHTVRTTDYTFWTEENCLKEIDKEIKRFKPDIVGITVLSMTRVSTYKVIKMIKTLYPKIKIVLGGMHSTMMYEQLLKNFPIDVICIGEAEDSFPEVVEALMKNKNMRSIKGIAYIKNRKLIITEQRKLSTNLDDLPYPNYDAFLTPDKKIVRVLSSRGCPNRCSYCCLHIISKQVWRPRSAKSVVDEIEYINKKYPWVEKVQFLDDIFTLDNQRVIDICKEIIDRNIKLKFTCQGRVKPVSKEMYRWMEKAGFVESLFGIETGSPKLLESIHKGFTQEDILNVFNILKDFKKIKPVKLMMIGFPGEDEKTVKETIEFSKKLHRIVKMDYFYVNPLWVYPGTEVYQLLKDKGAIDDSYWLSDKPCPIFSLEHDEKWIIKMANKIAIETMLSQGLIFFIFRLIKNFLSNPKHYFNRLFNKTIQKGINNE